MTKGATQATRSWWPFTEALELVGRNLFAEDWSPQDDDKLRAALRVLLEELHKGTSTAFLIPDDGAPDDSCEINETLWPSPEEIEAGNFAYDNLWFDPHSVRGRIKPKRSEVSGAAQRYYDSPLWHRYIGKPGHIGIRNMPEMLDREKPPTRKDARKAGRPKGAGAIDDSHLLKRARQLLDQGEARSDWDAATKVADGADEMKFKATQRRVWRKLRKENE